MNEKIVPVSENCLNYCVPLMSVLDIHKLIDDELVESDNSEELEKIAEEVYVKAEFSQIISAHYPDNYQSDSKPKESDSQDDLAVSGESEPKSKAENFTECLTIFAKEVAQTVIDAEPEDKAEVLDQKFQELYNTAIGEVVCDKVIELDEAVIIPFCPLREHIVSKYQE